MAALGLRPGAPKHLTYGDVLRRDVLLLEIDDSLLEEAQTLSLSIKGEAAGEAVLCTGDKTFALKQVETTNTVLLVQDALQAVSPLPAPVKGAQASNPGLHTQLEQCAEADSRDQIIAVARAGSHIETLQTAPQFSRLNDLLQASTYGRDDMDINEDGQPDTKAPPSFHDLLDTCQASSSELQAELQRVGALELDGTWRAVDTDFMATLTDMLLLTAQQQGWDLHAISEEGMCSALAEDGYDPRLVRHCMARLGQLKLAHDAATWMLDDVKVCRHAACSLLRGQGRWLLTTFQSRWAEDVPPELQEKVSMGMLKSEVLIEDVGGDLVVKYFPIARLPKDPGQRFRRLFDVRPKWELTDLEPFLAGLQAPGQSIQSLLLKHARASQTTPTGPMQYGPR